MAFLSVVNRVAGMASSAEVPEANAVKLSRTAAANPVGATGTRSAT